MARTKKVEVVQSDSEPEIKVELPEIKVKKPRKSRAKKVIKPESSSDSEEVKVEVPEVNAEPVKKSRKKRVKDPNAPKRPPSAWVLHVQATRAENPGMSYKDAMSAAKLTYKKPSKVTDV